MRAVFCKALGLDLPSCDHMNTVFCIDNGVVQANGNGNLHMVLIAEDIFDLHLDLYQFAYSVWSHAWVHPILDVER
jgi:hypothetical protein